MSTSLPRIETYTAEGAKVSMGYQQLTGLSAAKALTAPDGASAILICPEAQGVRYRDDGVNPTATVGMPLAVGEKLRFTGDLTQLRFIETTASAIVNVIYYR